MSAYPAKNFLPILLDYEFFEEHSTEAQEDARAFLASVKSLADKGKTIRMLDIGCGSGRFTEMFLEGCGIPADRLKLTLVEPVFGSLKTAAERLKTYSDTPIDARHDTVLKPGDRFDLVLANHVFYYIPEPGRTIRDLADRIDPGGVMLISMAGRGNLLIRIWQRCFSAIGVEIPYSVSEDIATILDAANADYRTDEIGYELVFPDTEENRLKICRFLMGEYFQRVPIRLMIDMFRGLEDGANIRATITHDHYVVRA